METSIFRSQPRGGHIVSRRRYSRLSYRPAQTGDEGASESKRERLRTQLNSIHQCALAGGRGCSRFPSQRPQHGGLGGIGKHLWNVVELLPHIHHKASLTRITLPFIPFPGRAPKQSLAGLRRLARRRSRLPCPGCQASLHREQRTTRRPQPSTTHLETLPGCSQQEQGKRDQSTVTQKNTSSL